MPVQQLPGFEHARSISGAQLDARELSECHGAVCGMLCRQPARGADDYLELLASMELVRDPAPEVRECLVRLYEATAAQITDEQMRFDIWLPSDEEPLEDRARALAHWASGFLAGLGMGREGSLEGLSEDLQGVLEDLQQISRADAVADGESEEEEAALVEIVEYLRVVTLMFREELRPASSGDSVH
ncbi:MAG: UPF0149 family protein [Xanthomonadales bacterium]|nr:UPF0149 family protein [Xanthomonadales bacterium]